MTRLLHLSLCSVAALAIACGESGGAGAAGGSDAGADVTGPGGSAGQGVGGWPGSAGSDAGSDAAGSGGAAGASGGAAGAAPCTTRIAYGDAWIHPPSHPDAFDDVTGSVSWDGACTDDAGNSTATLSNGWQPYFSGKSACVMALDSTCPGAPPCTTRITYGSAWIPAPNHPASYDDVPGRVYWDRSCTSSGGTSQATLSNGWAPHFNGGSCELSFEYKNCGGLYENPLIAGGCADPGVLRDGNQYVLVCTSGNAANAFPIRTSPDLVHWTSAGAIFPSGSKPSWAASDFWAPEIHHVGNHYVAYFTARGQDGKLAVGAATAQSAVGPFTDIGQPLVHDAAMGMIDASEFEDAGGAPYLVWKADGNAVGQPTPIYGQPLAPGGAALTGSRTQLIVNDRAWEGGVVEGPWVVKQGGDYYLFYSGNAYYNATYAVGVARATSPLGPYQKAGAPVLATNSAWIGPGHCSVVGTPAGDTVMLYHAWRPGHVNGPGDQRVMLMDAVDFSGGWPSLPEAPSTGSRPMP